MKMLRIFFLVFGMATLFGSCSLFSLTKGLNEMMGLEVKDVSLDTVADGSYTGSFAFERWSNTVEVKVQNHAITTIAIIKDVRFSKQEVSDAIFGRVIEEQSVCVDAVSGSTVTSKAYLKSIELALNE